MINPDVAPPLPPSIVPGIVRKLDGTRTQVVTVLDAARLVGRSMSTIEEWISKGTVEICYTPDHQRRVLVDSLWMACPIELRR